MTDSVRPPRDPGRGEPSGEAPAILAARTLLTTLVEAGLRHIVLAPGSRSAPLAFAALDLERSGDIVLHTRIDERSAAFTALGLASLPNPVVIPAAVITTSGTAVANLHPAVLEARHARIPLIVITADRPAELRGTGANQTTDQVGIFTSATRFAVDVPAPHVGEGSGGYIRDLAARAFAAATGADGGPPGAAHLNVSYREPLVPQFRDDWVGRWHSAKLETSYRPPVEVRMSHASPAVILDRGPRTVIVAGDRSGIGAGRFAESSGWPLLAEPSSGCRGRDSIAAYRFLIDHFEPGAIERVVVFGHPTLSRPVGRMLAEVDDLVVVADDASWPDPPRRACIVAAGVDVEGEASTVERAWARRWRDADSAAGDVIASSISEPGLTGLAIAEQVARAQRPGDVLWVGSSSAIRDLDLVPEGLDGVHVLAQRGLAGIDGTISAASGAALRAADAATGLDRDPNTTVYLGDLTFLHDIGGLLVGQGNPVPRLRIVVANDEGGAIFHTLEPGDPEYVESFERVFATPHSVDFSAVASAYGLDYHSATEDSLAALLARPLRGREVIEIKMGRNTRRVGESLLRDRVLSAIAAMT